MKQRFNDSNLSYNSFPQRAQWSSEVGFVFSMTAAAVGLGNLWRFPYMVGENGGAAFIIAYFTVLMLVALPIMMLEVAVGRLAMGNTVATYRKVHRWGAVIGWGVVSLTVVITSYYLVVTGWTLGYAVSSIIGNVKPFEEFTRGYASVWYFFIVVALAGVLLIRGVTAIEFISKLLMPLLLLIVIMLVLFARSTAGWAQAYEFLTKADYSLLKETRLWMFAIGQAFYSLAIGQGYLITYGSYIPPKVHVPRASLIVTLTETTVAFLAGWMIFPLVFTFGLAPDEGSQLAFVILPMVFDNIAWGGLLAVLFFSLFFAAAFSSCLAGLKVMVAAFAEEFSLGNAKAVHAVAALMIVLGLPSALSFTPLKCTLAGRPFLEVIDQLGGTNMVIVSGILGAGLFSWLVPHRGIRDALGTGSRYWYWRIVIAGRVILILGLILLVYALFK